MVRIKSFYDMQTFNYGDHFLLESKLKIYKILQEIELFLQKFGSPQQMHIKPKI